MKLFRTYFTLSSYFSVVKLHVITNTMYTEEQVHEVFRQAGDIKRIIMGLDRLKKTPCGFCFVEYFDRPDAETAVRFLNGAKLDDRQIRCDWDWGFDDGRQYGRGKSGGQVGFVCCVACSALLSLL